MEKSLIVFVKNAIVGKVKSRLAKDIGEMKALSVYKNLIIITHKTVSKLPVQKFVYYSNHIIKTDLWENDMFKKYLQRGEDLGERMYNAISDAAYSGAEKICLIGSDIPELNDDIILNAFEFLSDCDVVLGPAKDGGYYLIGMKYPIKPLFINKSWSTKHLMDETISEIEKLNLTYALLPTLRDIDFIEDIYDLGREDLLS